MGFVQDTGWGWQRGLPGVVVADMDSVPTASSLTITSSRTFCQSPVLVHKRSRSCAVFHARTAQGDPATTRDGRQQRLNPSPRLIRDPTTTHHESRSNRIAGRPLTGHCLGGGEALQQRDEDVVHHRLQCALRERAAERDGLAAHQVQWQA